ncbi:uncharacterized protein LOC115598955 [Calypte anna]|uniref:uncharacterized protein LOC115598955 n=1 Tax=Calypte anna TaxID=9244 RepID=UPI0011C455C2|nr:uncharacterized protein LOC115598955 [Calypte anna]
MVKGSCNPGFGRGGGGGSGGSNKPAAPWSSAAKGTATLRHGATRHGSARLSAPRARPPPLPARAPLAPCLPCCYRVLAPGRAAPPVGPPARPPPGAAEGPAALTPRPPPPPRARRTLGYARRGGSTLIRGPGKRLGDFVPFFPGAARRCRAAKGGWSHPCAQRSHPPLRRKAQSSPLSSRTCKYLASREYSPRRVCWLRDPRSGFTGRGYLPAAPGCQEDSQQLSGARSAASRCSPALLPRLAGLDRAQRNRRSPAPSSARTRQAMAPAGQGRRSRGHRDSLAPLCSVVIARDPSALCCPCCRSVKPGGAALLGRDRPSPATCWPAAPVRPQRQPSAVRFPKVHTQLSRAVSGADRLRRLPEINPGAEGSRAPLPPAVARLGRRGDSTGLE